MLSGRWSARHAAPSVGMGRAVAWTLLGAAVPGVALLAAGRRVGAVVLAAFAVLVAGALWLGTAGRRTALRWAVDPDVLAVAAVGAVALAVAWVLVVIAGYVSLVPLRAPRTRRMAGAGLVLGVCAAGAVPAVTAAGLALEQRELVSTVFAEDGRSATVVVREEEDEAIFGGAPRVNVLLLGGDAGEGREGLRTDTVIVASIDTATGDTSLINVPRNLQDLPFPPGSGAARAYPDGFEGATEAEGLLNAVYRNAPVEHPEALGPSDDPGADFLKLGVGEALGLVIDYYVLVDLAGFESLVDALGGVTLNVNYFVPVGGEPTSGRLPDAYIAPGPAQRMDGRTALDFARGRFGLTDYDRMARQRCVMDAIVAEADPVSLATRYGELAGTAQRIVSTDLPQALVDDAVELALLVKDAQIRSLVLDDSVITPADPDYARIRALVQQALVPPPPPASPAPSPALTAAPTATPPPSTQAPSVTASAAVSGSVSASPPPVADVADACAYDPLQARQALAEGRPPVYSDPD